MGAVKVWFANQKADFLDFRPGKPLRQKLGTITLALILNHVWLWSILAVLKAIFSKATLSKYIYWGWLSGQDVPQLLYASLISNLAVTIFFAVILAPLWEEFVFRAYWFWKKLRKRDKEDLVLMPTLAAEQRKALGKMPIWDFVVFSSMIFGVVHGGPINILIQGVGGLFLSYVFLHNGRSYLSGVALHALWNASLIIISYLGNPSAICGLTIPYWATWL